MDPKTQKRLVRFECGHCSDLRPMEVLSQCSRVLPEYDSGDGFPLSIHHDLLLCSVCGQVTLQQYLWMDTLSPEEVVYVTLYPQKSFSKSQCFPEKVKEAYSAALKVKNIDTNAYGVLLRRVLEIVCIDKNSIQEKEDLYDGLKKLSDDGLLPKTLVSVAHQLRILGNIGAHAFLGNLTEDEIPVLDRLCQAILGYVYELPELEKSTKDLLAKLRQEKHSDKKLREEM